ncbi:MAG: DUF87 domain-containing protein [Phycisphaerae bacterium]|nr:DUF87 domain-containing protein [Phycisphaerae bacterium]
MITRIQDLCRKLRPVLGKKIDRLWTVYLTESEPGGRAEIEQTLELLAAKHLGHSYEPDRSPFPPPNRDFAGAGDVPLGTITYGERSLYPFLIKSDRLKEHILVAGRSGSGNTNLTFILMQGIMARGIKVLALDWKRGYRDLPALQPDLRVYTIGRDVAPFRFNPLIPPVGCEPNVWIKLIVDVIASAYWGGEGVISLLVGGLDHLYRGAGVYSGAPSRWPTIVDLLDWLRTVKLRGRAAMWQASAERILLAHDLRRVRCRRQHAKQRSHSGPPRPQCRPRDGQPVEQLRPDHVLRSTLRRDGHGQRLAPRAFFALGVDPAGHVVGGFAAVGAAVLGEVGRAGVEAEERQVGVRIDRRRVADLDPDLRAHHAGGLGLAGRRGLVHEGDRVLEAQETAGHERSLWHRLPAGEPVAPASRR